MRLNLASEVSLKLFSANLRLASQLLVHFSLLIVQLRPLSFYNAHHLALVLRRLRVSAHDLLTERLDKHLVARSGGGCLLGRPAAAFLQLLVLLDQLALLV